MPTLRNRIALAAQALKGAVTFDHSHLFLTGQPVNGVGAQPTSAAYSNSWVAFSCIKRLATDAAGIPLRVLTDPDKEDSEAPSSNALAQLIKSPSPSFSQSEFVQWIVTWLNLRGEFFVTFDDPVRPKELLFWSDPLCWREIMQNERVVGWEYRKAGVQRQHAAINVIHHRYVNPMNPWRGQAPIAAAAIPYSIDVNTGRMQNDIVAKGGERSPIFSADADMTTPQRQAAIDVLRSRSGSGDGTQPRPVLLPAGITVVDPKFISADLSILDKQASQPDRICAVFGMSKSLLGFEDIDKYATFQGRLKVYFTQTLIPMLHGMEATFDAFFNRYMPSEYRGFVRFDLDAVSALADSVAEKFAAAVQAHNGGLPWTVCNDRFDLGLDLTMVPGADRVLVSSTLAPIDAVLDEWDNPAPTPPPPPAAAPPPPPTDGADGGDAPPPADDAPDKSDVRARSIKAVALNSTSAKQQAIIKRAKDTRSRLQRSHRLMKMEGQMRRDWKGIVGATMQRTLLALRDATTEAQASDAVSAGMGEFKVRARALAAKYHDLAVREGMRSIVELVAGKMSDAELHVWKSTAPWRPEVNAAIESRTKHIDDMSDALFDDVRDAALNSVREGLSYVEVANAVAERFDLGRGGFGRAITIARTEVGSAYNVARFAEMKANGFTKHMWITSDDELVRDGTQPPDFFDHAQCHEETVDIGEPFSCELTYPMEDGGEAGNVINCRCETIPIEDDSGDIGD